MDDGPVVGVAGATDGRIRTAVEAAGGTPDSGSPAAVVGDSDYLVTVGRPALLAVARAGVDVPVLPIEAGPGLRSVAGADGPAAVERLLAGEYERESHPLVAARVADRTRARALIDVALLTAGPGEISEYGVHADDEPVSQFRADGVVVATPAGSGDYASRAGGPVISPETGVVAVVPVAPFVTDPAHWVLPLSDTGTRKATGAGEETGGGGNGADVALSVERDENTVHLLADGRVVGTVRPDERVRLEPDGDLMVAVVAESRSPFDE